MQTKDEADGEGPMRRSTDESFSQDRRAAATMRRLNLRRHGGPGRAIRSRGAAHTARACP